jgi:hypothetical protein
MTVANVVIRQVLLKRGNTATMGTYTGPIGEVTVDTDLDTLRVQDGINAGGTLLATQDYVDNAVTTVGGAVDLAPVYANIASINANIATLYSNAATQSGNITSLTSNAAVQAAAIAALQATDVTLQGEIDTTNAQWIANVAGLRANIIAANAAIAALGSGVDSAELDALRANIDAANVNIAALQSVTSSQGADIVTLFANAVSQNSAIAGITANVNTNTGDIATLFANAAYQANWFSGLNSNAAIQDAAIASLQANAATQDSAITSLRSDLNTNVTTITGHLSTHDTAISTLTANAAGQAQLLYLLDANAASQNDYLNGLLANAAAQAGDIVALYANAATQTGELSILTANASTQTAALNVLTANAATQSSALTALAADLDAALSDITTLTANAAYQSDWLTSLTSNAGVQSDALVTLTANAAAQAATLVTLTANAATQANALDVITANLAVQTANAAVQTAALNVLTANAAGQSDYLDGLLANAATQAASLTTLFGNAAAQAGILTTINSNVAAANAAISALQSTVGSNSADIVTLFANAATQNSALTTLTANAAYQADWLASLQSITSANAATQAAQIDSINSNVSSLTSTVAGIITGTGFATTADLAANMAIANSAIVSATTGNITLSGTLTTANIILSVGTGGVFWANGTRYIPYGNVAVGNYVSTFNGPITSNILTVTNAIKSNIYQFANGVSIFSTLSSSTLGNLAAVDQRLIGNNSSSPILFGDANNSAQVVQAETKFVANASISSTNHTTGALVIPNGGLGVAGNVYLSGHADTRFQVGEGGQFLPNVLAQFTSNVDSYVQINMQNLNSGTSASSDFVATADNGDDSQNFIDMGIASSTYNYPGYTAIKPNDGYLLTNGGNLILSAGSVAKEIQFYASGTEEANLIGRWDSGNLTVNTHISATVDNTFDLGSPTNRFRHLYVGPGTVYLGNIKLSEVNGTLTARSVANPGGNDEVDIGDALSGASLGSFKISGSTLGTINNPNNGGWGGSDMYLTPDGEGSSYIYIPRNESVNNNLAIEVANFGTGGVRLVTGSGSWIATVANVSVSNPTQSVLLMPNNVTQVPTNGIQCPPNTDTVIYTGTTEWQHTIKLLLQAEGVEEGNSGQWDNQSAEMIVTKSFRNNTVAASLYGRVYTSVNPLATFTAQWNATTSRVEITCRPTSTSNHVYVRTFATEITTSD